MTVRKPGLVVTRRQALLGAGALAAPYLAKAAEPIRIGLLLAKTGQIAPQTEYLAQGYCPGSRSLIGA
jgi:branched-chain amino acid transport system substrate-binding protein